MSTELIDVQMPDGAIVSGVPKGTTQAEVLRRYQLSQKPAVQSDDRSASQVAADQALAAAKGFASPITSIPGQIEQEGIGKTLARNLTPIGIMQGIWGGLKAVGEDVVPNIVHNAEALRQAYGGPAPTFGPTPTQAENEKAAATSGATAGGLTVAEGIAKLGPKLMPASLDNLKIAAKLKTAAEANRTAAAAAPSAADTITNIDVTRPLTVIRQPLKILNTVTQPLRASIQESIANKLARGMPVTQAEIAADEAARIRSTEGDVQRNPDFLQSLSANTRTGAMPELKMNPEYPGPPKIATAQLEASRAAETPQQLFERVKAQRNAELPASQLGETAKGGFERPAPQPIPVIEPGETKLTPEAINKWMGTRVEDVTHGGNPGKQILEEGLLAKDVPPEEMAAATKENVDKALKGAGMQLEARLKTADANGATVDVQTPLYDANARVSQRYGISQDMETAAQKNVVDKIEAKYPNLAKLKTSDAHKLKVELGDSIDWKNTDNPVNQMMKEVYRGINDGIAATDETIKPTLRRWGNLYVASKNLKTAIAKQLVGRPTAPLDFGFGVKQ